MTHAKPIIPFSSHPFNTYVKARHPRKTTHRARVKPRSCCPDVIGTRQSAAAGTLRATPGPKALDKRSGSETLAHILHRSSNEVQRFAMCARAHSTYLYEAIGRRRLRLFIAVRPWAPERSHDEARPRSHGPAPTARGCLRCRLSARVRVICRKLAARNVVALASLRGGGFAIVRPRS